MSAKTFLVAGFIAAAGCVGAGEAGAQSVQNIMAEAGLLGRWANDCSKRPGDGNIHTIYRVEASGDVALIYDSGPGYKPLSYTINSARYGGAGQLTYDHVNRATGVTLTVVVNVTPTHLRVWSSRRSTGEVLVQDGRFTASGRDSPLQARCK